MKEELYRQHIEGKYNINRTYATGTGIAVPVA
jgi:hypothetical protein